MFSSLVADARGIRPGHFCVYCYLCYNWHLRNGFVDSVGSRFEPVPWETAVLGQLQSTILFLLALVVSISFHEFAHAWSAYELGDSTARNNGRLTLNPVRHFDPIGALMILFIGSGRAFCAGDDLKAYAGEPGQDRALVPPIAPGHGTALGTYDGLRAISQPLNLAINTRPRTRSGRSRAIDWEITAPSELPINVALAIDSASINASTVSHRKGTV